MKLSPEIKQFIENHASDDVKKLALQSKRYPDIDMQFVIRQIEGLQIAKNKIPTWYANSDIIYPKHLSLEQASSEASARYKMKLCEGNSMVDLTGGMGIDFSFLASRFEKSIYVEQQAELVDIAAYNMPLLGLKTSEVIQDDAISYLERMAKVDFIYIDPARRSSDGKKTVLIEDCTPNLKEIDLLLEKKATTVMIKLSPMLDISLAAKSIRNITDVHIISVNNECKELVFIKRERSDATIMIHCVNIFSDKTDVFSFSKDDEEALNIEHTSKLGKYLYEPNSSIIKAGGYKSIATRYSLQKLHPSSHLYTSDTLYSNFPGRKFEIENSATLNKKDIKTHLSNLSQANITTRNFPLSVAEIRKRTKLKDGGDIYIFATTLADEKKILILCKKV